MEFHARTAAELLTARDAVRALPRPWREDAVITVHGEIVLDATLQLGPDDSGRDGHRVRWCGVDGAQLGSAVAVGPWRLHDAQRNLWCAPAPDIRYFRQLWADGRRLTRVRSRGNPGWMVNERGYCRTQIERWRNLRDIEVVTQADWKQFRGLVHTVDNDVGYGHDCVLMTQPYWANSQLHPPWIAGVPAWIENAFELLGDPGQWYLDRTAATVWYVPLQGEDPAAMRFTAPRLDRLLEAEGLCDCTFENLAFTDATWRWEDLNSGFCEVQSGTRILGGPWKDFDATRDHWQHLPACLQFSHGRGLRFASCTFTRLGGAGLHLSRGSQGCAVEDCTFHDISASALVLGRPEDHHPAEADAIVGNRVFRNRIHHCAAEYRSCAALLAYWVGDTVIEHNELSEQPYTGISIGWGWGFKDATPTVQRGNRICGNRVHRCMLDLHDGAAIYSLSAQPGQVISGNWIDGWSGVGIYLDNGSRFVRVEGNVVTGLYESVSAQNEPNSDNDIAGNWFAGRIHARASNQVGANVILADGPLPPQAQAICTASGR